MTTPTRFPPPELRVTPESAVRLSHGDGPNEGPLPLFGPNQAHAEWWT